MRANRQLTGSVTWGVESTIPSSISGIVAVAADMNLTARAELTQAPCCSPFPWVGFSVINRWAAKIERGGTHTQEHTHTCSEGDGSECVCSFSHKYTLKLRQPSNATVHVSVNKQIHLQKLQCDWIPQTHTHTHTNTHTRAISLSPPPSSMSTCYPIYPPSDVILSYFDLHSPSPPSPFHFPLPQSLPLPASARPPSLRAEPHTQKPGQQLVNVIVVIFVRWRRAQWSRRAARVKEWKSETNVSNFSMIISGCWTVWRGLGWWGNKAELQTLPLQSVYGVWCVCVFVWVPCWLIFGFTKKVSELVKGWRWTFLLVLQCCFSSVLYWMPYKVRPDWFWWVRTADFNYFFKQAPRHFT